MSEEIQTTMAGFAVSRSISDHVRAYIKMREDNKADVILAIRVPAARGTSLPPRLKSAIDELAAACLEYGVRKKKYPADSGSLLHGVINVVPYTKEAEGDRK